jgi:hypothetical protein
MGRRGPAPPRVTPAPRPPALLHHAVAPSELGGRPGAPILTSGRWSTRAEQEDRGRTKAVRKAHGWKVKAFGRERAPRGRPGMAPWPARVMFLAGSICVLREQHNSCVARAKQFMNRPRCPKKQRAAAFNELSLKGFNADAITSACGVKEAGRRLPSQWGEIAPQRRLFACPTLPPSPHGPV